MFRFIRPSLLLALATTVLTLALASPADARTPTLRKPTIQTITPSKRTVVFNPFSTPVRLTFASRVTQPQAFFNPLTGGVSVLLPTPPTSHTATLFNVSGGNLYTRAGCMTYPCTGYSMMTSTPSYGYPYYPSMSAYSQPTVVTMSTATRRDEQQGLNLFDALGLPSEEGRLSWPLGLKSLRPSEETQSLRDRIEAEVALLVQEKITKGQLNGELAGQITDNVRRLHDLLEKREAYLGQKTFLDSQQFLVTLNDAVKMYK